MLVSKASNNTNKLDYLLSDNLNHHKVYTHVIAGIVVHTTLSLEDLRNPDLWTLRSVRAWARAVHARSSKT